MISLCSIGRGIWFEVSIRWWKFLMLNFGFRVFLVLWCSLVIFSWLIL